MKENRGLYTLSLEIDSPDHTIWDINIPKMSLRRFTILMKDLHKIGYSISYTEIIEYLSVISLGMDDEDE